MGELGGGVVLVNDGWVATIAARCFEWSPLEPPPCSAQSIITHTIRQTTSHSTNTGHLSGVQSIPNGHWHHNDTTICFPATAPAP